MTTCVILVKFLNVSGLQYSYLQNGDNNNNYMCIYRMGIIIYASVSGCKQQKLIFVNVRGHKVENLFEDYGITWVIP